MPNALTTTLPPLPALTALHVAPAASECTQPLLPWVESFPQLATLRCTCMHLEEEEVLPPPPYEGRVGGPRYGLGQLEPPLQLPALRDAVFSGVPASVVPAIARLPMLTRLTVC